MSSDILAMAGQCCFDVIKDKVVCPAIAPGADADFPPRAANKGDDRGIAHITNIVLKCQLLITVGAEEFDDSLFRDRDLRDVGEVTINRAEPDLGEMAVGHADFQMNSRSVSYSDTLILQLFEAMRAADTEGYSFRHSLNNYHGENPAKDKYYLII